MSLTHSQTCTFCVVAYTEGLGGIVST